MIADLVLDRRTFIGASEAPAICGVDPWRTAATVWNMKVHDVAEPAPNDDMMLGTALEPFLLREASRRLCISLIPGGQWRGANGILIAQPDGLAVMNLAGSRLAILEAKTTGLDGWGDDLSAIESVPAKVIVQVAAQMYCVPDAVVAWIPALIGRFGLKLRVYCLQREWLDRRGIIDHVATIIENFWKDHVLTRVAPPDSIPDVDVVSRIKREPGKRVQLAPEYWAALRGFATARDRRLAAEHDEERCRALLLQGMGDAEAANCPQGDAVVKEVIQNRSAQEAKVVVQRRLTVQLSTL